MLFSRPISVTYLPLSFFFQKPDPEPNSCYYSSCCSLSCPAWYCWDLSCSENLFMRAFYRSLGSYQRYICRRLQGCCSVGRNAIGPILDVLTTHKVLWNPNEMGLWNMLAQGSWLAGTHRWGPFWKTKCKTCSQGRWHESRTWAKKIVCQETAGPVLLENASLVLSACWNWLRGDSLKVVFEKG